MYGPDLVSYTKSQFRPWVTVVRLPTEKNNMNSILFQLVRSQILRLFLILMISQDFPVCEIQSQETSERPCIFSHGELRCLRCGECEDMRTFCKACPLNRSLETKMEDYQCTMEESKQCNQEVQEIYLKDADYLRYCYLNLNALTDENGILKRITVGPKVHNVNKPVMNIQRNRFIVGRRTGNERIPIHDSYRGFVGIYGRNFYFTFFGNSNYTSVLKYFRGNLTETNRYQHNANEPRRFFSLEPLDNLYYLKDIIRLISSIIYIILDLCNCIIEGIWVKLLVEVLCVAFIYNRYKYSYKCRINRYEHHIHQLKESIQKKFPFLVNAVCTDTATCKTVNEEESQCTHPEEKLAQTEEINSSTSNIKTNKKVFSDNSIEIYADKSIEHIKTTSSEQSHSLPKCSVEGKHDNWSRGGLVSLSITNCSNTEKIDVKDGEENYCVEKSPNDESRICERVNNIHSSEVYFPKDKNECAKNHALESEAKRFEPKVIVNAPGVKIKENKLDDFQNKYIGSSKTALQIGREISVEAEPNVSGRIKSTSQCNHSACVNNNFHARTGLRMDHSLKPTSLKEISVMHTGDYEIRIAKETHLSGQCKVVHLRSMCSFDKCEKRIEDLTIDDKVKTSKRKTLRGRPLLKRKYIRRVNDNSSNSLQDQNSKNETNANIEGLCTPIQARNSKANIKGLRTPIQALNSKNETNANSKGLRTLFQKSNCYSEKTGSKPSSLLPLYQSRTGECSNRDNSIVDKEDFLNIRSTKSTRTSNVATLRNGFDRESLPRLAKHTTSDLESRCTKYEYKVLLNSKKFEVVKTEKKITKNKGDFSLSPEKDVKLPVSKRKVWSLEKHLEKELHWSSEKRLKEKLDRPYFHHDYRSFCREWHRSSVFQRRHHVYTLLNMHERIETFKYWPADSPVSKIDLVEAGFIYKGDGYEVLCGTCNLVKADWTNGDVPLQIHKMLRPDCEFLKTTFPDLIVTNGQNVVDSSFPFGNEQSLINKIDAMSISFPNFEQSSGVGYFPQAQASGGNLSQQPFNPFLSSMPHASAIPQQPMFNTSPVNPGESFPVAGATASDSLSISGVSPKHPEFSAIQDRIASFRPWSFSHLQDPVYLVDAGFYYIGREDIVRCYFCDIGLAEWDAEDDPWVEHARHSPECEYLKKERGNDFIESIQSSWRQIYSPRHPEFSDYHVRIQSFTNWPTHLDQRPNILAEAGFFYTGEDDVVRCHYCDGGLRQWEAGDDPWTEHARWFPFCKYIVKIKGLVFIEEIARRYNEVYESSPNDPTTLQMVNEDHTSPATREPYRTPLSNEVVERILELGYNRRQVNLAFHHHVQMTGRRHATADELTNILLENDFNVAPPVNNQPSSAAKENTKKTTSDIENLEPQKLVDLNLQLKQQLMCNICKQRESSIVFSPCGHRIACEECSRDTTVCFSCGDEIRKKIKTYLA